MTKKFIVNVDDYGFSTSTNNRIIEAFKKNRISSISTFSNYNKNESGISLLKKYKIPTGIHLNVSKGTPLTNGNSLVSSDGRFLEYSDSNYKNIDPNELENEFKKQIEVAANQSIEVTHLDNHRSEIYFYPELYKICLKLSKSYNIPIRFPFLNLDDLDKNNISTKLGIQLDSINNLEKKYLDLYYDLNIKSPDKVYIDELSNTNLEHLFNNIVNLKESSRIFTIEICVHLNDSDLENYNYLLSDKYISLINEKKFNLVNYKNGF